MQRSNARKTADGEEFLLVRILKLMYEDLDLEFLHDLFEFLNKNNSTLSREKVIRIEHVGADSSGIGRVEYICENKTIYFDTKCGKGLLLVSILKLIYENRESSYDLFGFLNKIYSTLNNEKVIRIEHIGADSRGIGDIKCICENKPIYIETKFGKDTLANIGQNSLTSQGVFSDALSWSEFRKTQGFDKSIADILQKHNSSNVDITKRSSLADFVREIKTKLGVQKNTEPILRDIIENNKPNIEEAQSLMSVIEIANENKKDYIKYLSTRALDQDKLKKFFNSVSSGITPKKRLIPEDNYEYYYVTPSEIKKINKLDLDNFAKEEFSVKFHDTYIEITNGEETVRVVFHWKNVMQGIQTPCLNLFRIKNNEKKEADLLP